MPWDRAAVGLTAAFKCRPPAICRAMPDMQANAAQRKRRGALTLFLDM